MNSSSTSALLYVAFNFLILFSSSISIPNLFSGISCSNMPRIAISQLDHSPVAQLIVGFLPKLTKRVRLPKLSKLSFFNFLISAPVISSLFGVVSSVRFQVPSSFSITLSYCSGSSSCLCRQGRFSPRHILNLHETGSKCAAEYRAALWISFSRYSIITSYELLGSITGNVIQFYF